MNRILNTIAVSITCILLGGLLGGITNSLNAWISPLYFKNIMHWDNVDNIWRAGVAQGIFEGLMYGFILSFIFTIVYSVSTKNCYSYLKAIRFLTILSLVIFGFWLIGGLFGLLLALISPEFYQKTFIAVPDNFSEMLKYAWVGGSIWGILAGGFLSVIVGSILFYSNQKKSKS